MGQKIRGALQPDIAGQVAKAELPGATTAAHATSVGSLRPAPAVGERANAAILGSTANVGRGAGTPMAAPDAAAFAQKPGLFQGGAQRQQAIVQGHQPVGSLMNPRAVSQTGVAGMAAAPPMSAQMLGGSALDRLSSTLGKEGAAKLAFQRALEETSKEAASLNWLDKKLESAGEKVLANTGKKPYVLQMAKDRANLTGNLKKMVEDAGETHRTSWPGNRRAARASIKEMREMSGTAK